MLPGPREARLQSVRDNQAQRLSVDTHAVREARLQSVRDTEVVCGKSRHTLTLIMSNCILHFCSIKKSIARPTMLCIHLVYDRIYLGGGKRHPWIAMSDRKWAWPNIYTALSMETLGTARLQK